MKLKMEENESFEEYMLYGIKEKISLKKCVENEILIILFSLPSIIIGVRSNILGMLVFLPIIFYLIFIFKSKKGQTIEGVWYILHNGVFSGCFSFIFALTGIEILFYLFEGKERRIVICMISLGYFFVILLYSYIIKKLMIKKDYCNTRKVKGKLFFILCGILGITVARVFLNAMDTRKALELLCIFCFFLSYLTLIGIFNIFKFQYLVKHQEILEK